MLNKENEYKYLFLDPNALCRLIDKRTHQENQYQPNQNDIDLLEDEIKECLEVMTKIYYETIGKLATAKQYQAYSLLYKKGYTLSEIGDMNNVSASAIFKRIEGNDGHGAYKGRKFGGLINKVKAALENDVNFIEQKNKIKDIRARIEDLKL